MIKNKYNIFTIFLVVLIGIFFSIFLLKPSWVIGSDGFGYYSYARSIIFDNNLDFYNEFSLFDNLFDQDMIGIWITPAGKIGNPFSVGPAILWTPFVLLAEVVQKIFPYNDPYAIPGFNLPFQIAVGLSTILYTSFGLVLTFLFLGKFFRKDISWWSVILMLGISPLPYYLIYEPSMSHGLTVFSVSILIYLSILLNKEEQIEYKKLLYLGASMGLVFIIRWQDIIFSIIPIGIILKNFLYIKKQGKDILNIFKYGIVILAGFLIIASIQIIAWQQLYSSFIAVPQGSSFFDLTNPHFWNFLFSGYHGMLFINPMLVFPILGLFLFLKKDKYLASLFLLALFAQIYLNAGVWDWYGGGSFGARRMLSSFPILAFGLAVFIKRIIENKIVLTLMISLFFISIVFNGLLMISYARGIIPLYEPTTRIEVYSAPFKVFEKIDF